MNERKSAVLKRTLVFYVSIVVLSVLTCFSLLIKEVNASTKQTVSQALGITASQWTNFLDTYGRNDNPYFVGTPYGAGYYIWWTPNGWKGKMPSSSWNSWGGGHMQCTGFVQAALLTAKLGENPFSNPNWYQVASTIPNCPGAKSVGVPCAGSWSSWAASHNVEYYVIHEGTANMNALYNSKHLERGDIVFGCCPYNSNYSHIMIYMGKDASGVPMFWDSIDLNANKGNQVHSYVKLARIGYPFSSFIIYKNPALPKDTTIPSLVSLANTQSGQILKWEKVKGAEKYSVYYKTTGQWIKLGETKNNTYAVPASKLSSGKVYTYTVRSKKGKVLSGYDKLGIKCLYLSTPKLSSVKNRNGYQTVSWEAVKGAKGYRVYIKNANGTWKYLSTTTKTMYNNKSVSIGKTNTYTIRAVYESVLSSYSGKGISQKYIAAPKLISVTNAKGYQKIKWGKVADAKAYKVYVKDSKGQWKYIATTTKTTYDNKSVKKGKEYTYTVVAINADIRSGHISAGISRKY